MHRNPKAIWLMVAGAVIVGVSAANISHLSLFINLLLLCFISMILLMVLISKVFRAMRKPLTNNKN